VNWLLGKLQERQNVILGDEMGLGKTIQVLSQRIPTPQGETACIWHLRAA
jgi:SNF2 family DNA or RNA helicase